MSGVDARSSSNRGIAADAATSQSSSSVNSSGGVGGGAGNADSSQALERELHAIRLQFYSLQCYTYLALLFNLVLFVTIASLLQSRQEAPYNEVAESANGNWKGNGENNACSGSKEARGARSSFWLSTPFLVGICAILNGVLGISYYHYSQTLLR